MPSSVQHLLASADLTWHSAAPWGDRPNLDAPGVYLASTSSDPSVSEVPAHARWSEDRIAALLTVRPEMTVGGLPATPERLAGALQAMWPQGENVLYIGLAGTSVADRVGKYYTTPLGARSPHAGGWPLKMLADLDSLYVHVAAAQHPTEAEEAALTAFMAGVSPQARAALSDPSLPLPFANLELTKGLRKRHGIRGAKQPRAATTRCAVLPDPPTAAMADQAAITLAESYSLNVTAADIASGQIRVTRDPKRALALPVAKTTVAVNLRGESMTPSWDPRMGPDQERSGLLRIGKEAATRLLGAPTTLSVGRDATGLLYLR